MSFLLTLFLPLAGALAAPFIHRAMGSRAGWVLALIPAYCVWQWATLLARVVREGAFTIAFDWVPALGYRFSFLLDGLSLLFALLISGIGALIIIYAGGYLKGHAHQGRFFSFIFAFMGAMLGVVLADNIIALFVFWELTSLTSFLLIGFNHNQEPSRRAALQALIITGGGGLAMLAGLLLLAQIAGATDLSAIMAAGETVRAHAAVDLALILILCGAFTKSAQFPFHFWLPNAMQAPTPVSAYLHSATMVKAGVFLVMRLNPLFGDLVLWQVVLPLFGGATLLAGALLALRQTDLKLILAYTTVASLGLLVMLVGVASPYAVTAAVMYLIAHALFKGCLFMCAGVVDHESGTRELTRLGGLRGVMPVTASAAALAALSMAGIPLFAGFVAKETQYEALLHGETVLLGIAILGNAMMGAAGAIVAIIPFWGPKKDTPKAAHEGPPALVIGPAILALAGLVAFFLTASVDAWLVTPASRAIAGQPTLVHIHAFAGFNLAFALSAITVAVAVALFLTHERVRAFVARMLRLIGWGPDRGFDQVMGTLIQIAAGLTRRIQTGQMSHYMMATFVATALVLIVPMVVYDTLPSLDPLAFGRVSRLQFYEWGVLIVAALGIVSVLVAKTRLIAIISLGIHGFSVALIFILFGAPDLSFTQFMVETLSVVILALVMTRLRVDQIDERSGFVTVLRTFVALACGAGFTLVLLSVVQGELDLRLSDFYTQTSAAIAHGRNIVNVILVDYRALDTLGEITVVMIAGVSALALIRIRTPRQRTGLRRKAADAAESTYHARQRLRESQAED